MGKRPASQLPRTPFLASFRMVDNPPGAVAPSPNAVSSEPDQRHSTSKPGSLQRPLRGSGCRNGARFVSMEPNSSAVRGNLCQRARASVGRLPLTGASLP
jgi:hypothetical protein